MLRDVIEEAAMRRLRARLAPAAAGVPAPEPRRLDAAADAAPPQLDDLLALHDEAFVDAAYAALLGRPPDAAGRGAYLTALREGRITKRGLVAALCRSPEGRRQRRSRRGMSGLRALVAGEMALRLPLAGRPIRLARNVLRLPGLAPQMTMIEARIERRLTELDRRGDALAALLAQGRAELDAAARELRAQRARLDAVAAPSPGPAARDLDGFFAGFEEAFRGTPESVLGRLKAYDRWLDPHWLPPAALPILEIGCGRGLWLGHCRDLGLAAYGVDINERAAAAARAAGLDARCTDALLHLRGLPERSLRALAAFHVLEHLPFADQLALLGEAARVLAPGGLLLVETPNPGNLLVGSYFFWSDPSHLRPIVPATLEFAAKECGLIRTEIVMLHRYDAYEPDAVGTPVERQWLFGPMDYALIAYAPGSEAPREGQAP